MRLTIAKMQAIARSKGGKCLSKKYVNTHTNLQWQCALGHRWKATPSNVKYHGTWCPKCFGVEKHTIEKMRELAFERGGKCLSKKYVNAHKKLTFQCSKGHTWEANANHIISRNSWCPSCSGNEKLTIEDMHQLAHSRNGECLSKKYVDNKTNLVWKCSQGHIWKATPSNVKNHGKWCRQCNVYFREELCRTTLEQLFDKKFPRVRPDWLINDLGNKLELDGYCEELMIAFEHQGRQHQKVSYYTATTEHLERTQKNDEIKLKTCNEKGVLLFIFREQDDILQFAKKLKSFLRLNGKHYPTVNFKKSIDYNKIYFHRSKIDELKKLARDRGGICHAEIYQNNSHSLKWECSEGHYWMATARNVKNHKSWCPVCARNQPLRIEIAKSLAEERGGKCLSDKYISGRENLKWSCSKGHVWEATLDSVKNKKTWCAECMGVAKGTIEVAKTIALKRGGKCLSDTYKNNKSKLKWKCRQGHIWLASLSNVKNHKSWCPKCAGKKASGI